MNLLVGRTLASKLLASKCEMAPQKRRLHDRELVYINGLLYDVAGEKISHPNCPQLSVLEAVCVPHLRGLHVTVPEEIPHLKNCRAHIEQPRPRVSTQFVACFRAILDPLRNPL